MATENKIEVKRPENFGVWVLVINKKGEVILGKRKNSFMAGWWGAPGGRVNLDEPLEKAAQRELEEETGIQHNQFEFVGTVRDLQGT